MCSAKRHVRFTPKSGHVRCNSICPLSADSGHRPMPAILLRPNISQRVSNAMERALLKKWRFTGESGLNCRKYDVQFGRLPRQPINHLSVQRGAPRSRWLSQLQSCYRRSAAASKSTFPNGVAGLLAFAEELHIRHDWLVGMVRLPMRNVCLVIGNTNHQTRSARAPITCGPHRTGGLVEQSLQIRHGDLPRLLRARFPLRSAADCPALFGY